MSLNTTGNTPRVDWIVNAMEVVRLIDVAGEKAGPLTPYTKVSAGTLLELLETVQVGRSFSFIMHHE